MAIHFNVLLQLLLYLSIEGFQLFVGYADKQIVFLSDLAVL